MTTTNGNWLPGVVFGLLVLSIVMVVGVACELPYWHAVTGVALFVAAALFLTLSLIEATERVKQLRQTRRDLQRKERLPWDDDSFARWL